RRNRLGGFHRAAGGRPRGCCPGTPESNTKTWAGRHPVVRPTALCRAGSCTRVREPMNRVVFRRRYALLGDRGSRTRVRGAIAQLVEHWSCIPEVWGSTPHGSTANNSRSSRTTGTPYGGPRSLFPAPEPDLGRMVSDDTEHVASLSAAVRRALIFSATSSSRSGNRCP